MDSSETTRHAWEFTMTLQAASGGMEKKACQPPCAKRTSTHAQSTKDESEMKRRRSTDQLLLPKVETFFPPVTAVRANNALGQDSYRMGSGEKKNKQHTQRSSASQRRWTTLPRRNRLCSKGHDHQTGSGGHNLSDQP